MITMLFTNRKEVDFEFADAHEAKLRGAKGEVKGSGVNAGTALCTAQILGKENRVTYSALGFS